MKLEVIQSEINHYDHKGLPPAGDHELHDLVVETVSRLPKEIQFWLTNDCTHYFIGGFSQNDVLLCIYESPVEPNEGWCFRVILLPESLRQCPKETALWCISKGIAQSRLDVGDGDESNESEVDKLVLKWGFEKSPDC